MKRFSEQFKKKSETIVLTVAEKNALKARVVSYMEYHPLPKSATRITASRFATDPGIFVKIPARYLKACAGVFVLTVIVGVPALAENAIPGDVLYPIKVQVTEEIRSSLNRGSYEKVVWETTRLERRLSEARQLAQAGRLTPEVEASVTEAVKVHKDAAQQQIAALRTTDAEGATLAEMTFSTVLDVQTAVLKASDTASTTEGMSMVALTEMLDASRPVFSTTDNLENLSIERLKAQLEIETTRCYELLKNISPVATAQEQKDIERRLGDVTNKIEDALAVSNENPAEAKAKMVTAWSDVQKLISFMTDIDVRAAIALEELVPVVLTEAERRVALDVLYVQTSVDLARITTGLEAITDEGVAEKISLTLPRINELLVTASSTVDADLTGAETAVTEAKALTDSILGITTFPSASEVEVSEPVGTTTTPIEFEEATTTDPVATSTESGETPQ